jgi:hypothetical protein
MIAYFHVEETVVRAPAPQCYDLVAAVRRHGEWWLAHSTALGPEGVLRVGSRFSLASGGLRWKLSGLEVKQSLDTLYGQGATQADGRLVLDLTGRGRQMRFTGGAAIPAPQ